MTWNMTATHFLVPGETDGIEAYQNNIFTMPQQQSTALLAPVHKFPVYAALFVKLCAFLCSWPQSTLLNETKLASWNSQKIKLPPL